MRIVAPLVCLVAASSFTQLVRADEVDTFAVEIEKPLRLARYMEAGCSAVSIVGWEGFDTRKCRYSVKDPKTGITKTGLVVLLDPSAHLLSAWIVNACRTVRPQARLEGCAQRVFERVLEQSGGQFPVAGIVYEDILPEDGVHEAYGFANGVTTILKGVQHRRVDPFSDQELEAALSAQPLKTASEAGFARLVGVSRGEYLQANPTAKVEGLDWLAIVREEYQRAMKSERNLLIEAWLRAQTAGH